MKTANEFAKRDDVLKVRIISQKGLAGKSDVFLITLNDFALLIDGGMTGVPTALEALLEYRKELLIDYPELVNDENVKLEIVWVASHSHIDHIGAFMDYVVSSPFISISDAYIPPRTSRFDPIGASDYDGDYKYRTRLSSLLLEYQKETAIHNLPFSSKDTYPIGADNLITLLPPCLDWGKAELVKRMTELYDADIHDSQIPIGITNSNSLWVLVSYRGKKFLFTGDSMKKTEEKDESFDRMLASYAPLLGAVDVVKYPHHGLLRDQAAEGVASLNPSFILYTGINPTGDKAMEKTGSEASAIYSGMRDVIFTVDRAGKLELQEEAE